MAAIFLLSSGLVASARAQAPPEDAASWRGTILSVAASGVVYAAPRLLDLGDRPPACAPCDPADVPGFDRWIIRPEMAAWSVGSTVTLLALGAATTWSRGFDRQGLRHSAAALEAAAWAIALTEVAKALVARYRPVLYTVGAPAAAADLDSRRSLPSSHTAAGFAIATSYWLDGADHPLAARLTVLTAAAGVAVMRVAAARHFPSDVLAGAALGTLSAVIVHEIRF